MERRSPFTKKKKQGGWSGMIVSVKDTPVL